MAKKILAINGSPRKTWNTATLLNSVLDGARSTGAEGELVNLYDLDYKGCISCFACKRKGVIVDQCVVKDDLYSLLAKVRESDAVVLGSPFYFWEVTGEMRSFLERLLFPYFSYDNQPNSFGKSVKSAFVYTMGISEEIFEKEGPRFKDKIADNAALLTTLFGQTEELVVCDTYQFNDYSKYATGMFDPAHKANRRDTVFKEECNQAFELGVRLVS